MSLLGAGTIADLDRVVAEHPGMTDWAAGWIAPVEADDLPARQRPGYQLAGSVRLGPVASATLRATAHGLYEAFVNGTRVGDVELTPGFTAYRSRLQVHTFDVTDAARARATT